MDILQNLFGKTQQKAPDSQLGAINAAQPISKDVSSTGQFNPISSSSAGYSSLSENQDVLDRIRKKREEIENRAKQYEEMDKPTFNLQSIENRASVLDKWSQEQKKEELKRSIDEDKYTQNLIEQGNYDPRKEGYKDTDLYKAAEQSGGMKIGKTAFDFVMDPVGETNKLAASGANTMNYAGNLIGLLGSGIARGVGNIADYVSPGLVADFIDFAEGLAKNKTIQSGVRAYIDTKEGVSEGVIDTIKQSAELTRRLGDKETASKLDALANEGFASNLGEATTGAIDTALTIPTGGLAGAATKAGVKTTLKTAGNVIDKLPFGKKVTETAVEGVEQGVEGAVKQSVNTIPETVNVAKKIPITERVVEKIFGSGVDTTTKETIKNSSEGARTYAKEAIERMVNENSIIKDDGTINTENFVQEELKRLMDPLVGEIDDTISGFQAATRAGNEAVVREGVGDNMGYIKRMFDTVSNSTEGKIKPSLTAKYLEKADDGQFVTRTVDVNSNSDIDDVVLRYMQQRGKENTPDNYKKTLQSLLNSDVFSIDLRGGESLNEALLSQISKDITGNGDFMSVIKSFIKPAGESTAKDVFMAKDVLKKMYDGADMNQKEIRSMISGMRNAISEASYEAEKTGILKTVNKSLEELLHNSGIKRFLIKDNSGNYSVDTQALFNAISSYNVTSQEYKNALNIIKEMAPRHYDKIEGYNILKSYVKNSEKSIKRLAVFASNGAVYKGSQLISQNLRSMGLAGGVTVGAAAQSAGFILSLAALAGLYYVSINRVGKTVGKAVMNITNRQFTRSVYEGAKMLEEGGEDVLKKSGILERMREKSDEINKLIEENKNFALSDNDFVARFGEIITKDTNMRKRISDLENMKLEKSKSIEKSVSEENMIKTKADELDFINKMREGNYKNKGELITNDEESAAINSVRAEAFYKNTGEKGIKSLQIANKKQREEDKFMGKLAKENTEFLDKITEGKIDETAKQQKLKGDKTIINEFYNGKRKSVKLSDVTANVTISEIKKKPLLVKKGRETYEVSYEGGQFVTRIPRKKEVSRTKTFEEAIDSINSFE